MAANSKSVARFDARLSMEQKALFERAALLSGFRNLTEFIMQTVQLRSHEIIQQHEQIIASKRDANLFFDSITKPAKPNAKLRKAYRNYTSTSRAADA